MRIAVPVCSGRICRDFAACEECALFDVEGLHVKRSACEIPPTHQPQALPDWLAARGVKLVIAGRMRGLQSDSLGQRGIRVVDGAPVDEPETVVRDYLLGQFRPVQRADN